MEFTNKLEWKKARTFWKIDIFQKLKNYQPFGPKIGKVPYFALVNRQYEIFDQFFNPPTQFEEIKETNYALARLLEFMYISKLSN